MSKEIRAEKDRTRLMISVRAGTGVGSDRTARLLSTSPCRITPYGMIKRLPHSWVVVMNWWLAGLWMMGEASRSITNHRPCECGQRTYWVVVGGGTRP